ncbi:Rrf2 family transcriptional regulator [Tenacibaculum aiptasiae]|uniref:Rrf2 family transcriptional regulator n=2 Tax=Tenacibaculum aiptasiae TaxID=426481 RepID=A0A7J5AC60_9FLAO|nr:Rrf2 family transcriptional regulator [Tenacibaculum aiptasiae]KAB1154669.1 Rrf2 family transcriptional regulator [Tenacibaculum aiptasiae]
MFSKSCEYAMRAILYIAKQSFNGNKTGVKEIAKATNSPEAFTAKILQKLTKNNIVNSIKGPYGGFLISESKSQTIKLSEIVKVIDGNEIYTGCGLGLRECNAKNPCPIHHKFIDIRRDLKTMLETTTIYDLIKSETGENKILQLKR